MGFLRGPEARQSIILYAVFNALAIGCTAAFSAEALAQYYRLICCKVETPKDEHGCDLWYEGALATLFLAWAQQERFRIAEEIAVCVKAQDSETVKSLLEQDKTLLGIIEQSYHQRRMFQSSDKRQSESPSQKR